MPMPLTMEASARRPYHVGDAAAQRAPGACRAAARGAVRAARWRGTNWRCPRRRRHAGGPSGSPPPAARAVPLIAASAGRCPRGRTRRPPAASRAASRCRTGTWRPCAIRTRDHASPIPERPPHPPPRHGEVASRVPPRPRGSLKEVQRALRDGFALEQQPLALHTPAVARQPAVVAHDPVAGDGHRVRVGRARLRHRPHRPRRADARGDRRSTWFPRESRAAPATRAAGTPCRAHPAAGRAPAPASRRSPPPSRRAARSRDRHR